MDKHMAKNLTEALEPLHLPVVVYTTQGVALYSGFSGEAPALPALRFVNDRSLYNGVEYVRTSTTPMYIIAMPIDAEAADTHCLLIARLIEALLSATEVPPDKADLIAQVLKNNLEGTELETLALELNVEQNAERCVVFFQTEGSLQPLSAMLAELLEGSPSEYIVELGRNALALVRDMRQFAYQELPEFIHALGDTLMEENGATFKAGIGEPQADLAHLHKSLEQAREALETGRVFSTGETVFIYRYLILERFLMEIPFETARKYHEVLFNRRNARVFSEEMIQTIDTFFDCHLNVSEAARRLFIHRNTLVYRLDKVLKTTGLDLRTFEDAITFRVLRMLGKREDI